MGVDRAEQDKQQQSFKMSGPRVWLPLDVLQGAAYASVSTTAKALLVDLAAQLRAKNGNIYNNGDLTTAMKVLSKVGWSSDKTVRAATKKLVEAKLISLTRQGHLPNVANLYGVTWLPLNESKKFDTTSRGFPFKAYKLADRPRLKAVD